MSRSTFFTACAGNAALLYGSRVGDKLLSSLTNLMPFYASSIAVNTITTLAIWAILYDYNKLRFGNDHEIDAAKNRIFLKLFMSSLAFAFILGFSIAAPQAFIIIALVIIATHSYSMGVNYILNNRNRPPLPDYSPDNSSSSERGGHLYQPVNTSSNSLDDSEDVNLHIQPIYNQEIQSAEQLRESMQDEIDKIEADNDAMTRMTNT